VALIGYAAVLTWRPGSTELVKSVIRHREDETEGESRKRWRGLIPFLLPVFVLLAIINAIHLPKAAFVLWAATFIPIGAVDMGHWEHCKAVVRGRPEDPEIATMNRVARRTGPDYIDTFERWWALATGLVAFVLPWFVFITSISNDSRLAWGVRMVWMALLLGVLLGVVCVIAGRRSRRIGRIGTAIIIGDVVGALLFFVSLILWLVVGYTFFYRDG
jgi:hypothetical protein